MPPTTTDVDALAERVRQLEAENAALADGRSREPAQGGRWRAFVSALCIVIAAILVPVSIAGAWARVQLVDEDSFVQTLAPLVDDEDVQALIVDEAMTAIDAQVDFTDLTDSVFDGITDLGVGPRAAAALDLLRQPAADAVAGLVESTVTNVVQSDAFSDIWATTVRGAHRALTVASTSDGGGVVVMDSDGVGIALGPVVERVKQTLVERGLGAASLIPAVDRTVIIGSGETLTTIRTAYAVAATLGWWLPVIDLALFGLGILLARRRSVAVLGTGVALALGGASLGIALAIGSTAVGMVAGQLGLSPSALDVIYAQLVDDMRQTAWIIALLGVVVAIIGWFTGRSKPARRTRATIDSLNASARRALAGRGLDTGGFGAWLGRHRVAVRIGIAVLAVLWLFALRPLGVGDILLVLVVALVVGWVLELLQRRPEERGPGDPVADDEIAHGDGIDTDAPASASEETDAGASGAVTATR